MRRRVSRPSAAPDPAPVAVTIDWIGHAGDGLGTLPDGRRICIAGTLPGEQVTASPIGRDGAVLVARVDAWQSTSVERVAPPCPHFGACGGCTLQHWESSPYRAWKADRLRLALRQAGYADPPVGATVCTPPASRRRIDLAFATAGTSMTLGLHTARGHGIVDLHDCAILHPDLLALLVPLRTALAGLSASRQGGSVHVNLLDNGPDVLICARPEPTGADRDRLLRFARAASVVRVHWSRGAGTPELICALDAAVVRFGDVNVTPPPGAFLQATREGERAITSAVLDALPNRLPKRARFLDLYAGCGTLTFALAAHGSVTAYEGEETAFAALRQGAHRALPGRVTCHHRDLVRQPLTGRELLDYALITLDPPWAGAPVQVAALAAADVDRIAYVSCNPAALRADATTLSRAGFKVSAATPIDQFLWSAHLESVVVFTR